MTRRRHKAQIGSVSSGTVLPEDLIPTFIDTYRHIKGRLPRDVFKKYRHWQTGNDLENESDLLSCLFALLECVAPPYTYFGAHKGDRTDYGFWLDDIVNDQNFDGLRVSDTSEVPKGYRGEVLHVNDHGNMTLYVANSRGLKEIWAVV